MDVVEAENPKADRVTQISDDHASDRPVGKKRKAPNLSEKLASALLTICRPDESGVLRPVIDREEAKTMTVKQILARFEYDHGVLHALDGSDHPTNLTPRPVAEHRKKSSKDTKIVAKVRRIAPAHEDFRRRMLAKSGQGEEHMTDERKKRGPKLKSRGFQGSRKFNGDVSWKGR